MFDIDSFVADCRAALVERSSDAIRDVVRRAVAEPDAILKVLGEPSGASAINQSISRAIFFLDIADQPSFRSTCKRTMRVNWITQP